MSPDQNELMTRVGPGTRCGALMRHYWNPVALADELPAERPAKPVRVLGQDFVLFRDELGRHGLLDRDCPHRGADLAFGRLEDGGLRCLFHGWLFDVDGRCLETPAEPEGSVLCQRVRQRSYPVAVKNGIVFAWLGDGEAPAFPDFDCFLAPGTHAFAFKGLIECNWLQALEVGIDPAHASYLHRFYEDEDTGAAYGKQFRSASSDSDIPMTRLLREFDCHHRRRIGKHTVTMRSDFSGDFVSKLLQTMTQYLVIITPPRIHRHHRCRRIRQACRFACGPVLRRTLRHIIHPRTNHPYRTRHQFSRSRPQGPMRCHIIHLPVKACIKPALQTRFGPSQMRIGYAHLRKAQPAAPLFNGQRQCGIVGRGSGMGGVSHVAC